LPADGVKIQRLGAVSFGKRQATRLLIGRTAEGGRIPALYFSGEGSQRPVVLVHAVGKAACFTEEGGTVQPGELLGGLLDAGRPALLIDAYLTGDYQTPAALCGRDQSSPHFLTFNQSDTALRVQDVVTAVAAARELGQTDTVDLVGLGEAGLWCVLARPLASGVGLLVASGAGFAADDDDEFLHRLDVPGLRRCGGLATALLLAAPAPVQLFAFPALAATEPAQRLYGALGAADRFRAQAGAVDEVQLLPWLANSL
jgi:hypothetical protein